jgi:uroporphyrinogen decarboxylase
MVRAGGISRAEDTRPQILDSLLLRACRREPVERTPVWLMRQAGRYLKEYRDVRDRVGFLELCKTPDLAAQVTLDAVRVLGVDAAIVFADLLLPVEPMGFRLAYGTGEGPSIAPPVRTARDVDRVRVADPAALGYVYEAVKRVRAALAPEVALIGFVGAPFTLAAYLIEGGGTKDFARTLAFMSADPGAWRALLEKAADSLAAFANGQVAAGAQVIQVFDSWVGCVPPADYRERVLPHSRRLIRAVRGAPVIHFGTGTGALLERMKEAGGDVIGVDHTVRLDAAWERLGPGVGIQGNLDPDVLLKDVPSIRAEAKRILAEAGGRPGHIFNLGHGIKPATPVEHAVALVEAVREMSGR